MRENPQNLQPLTPRLMRGVSKLEHRKLEIRNKFEFSKPESKRSGIDCLIDLSFRPCFKIRNSMFGLRVCMAWRLHEHVLRGRIDNRGRGCVTGEIWLAGIGKDTEPVSADEVKEIRCLNEKDTMAGVFENECKESQRSARTGPGTLPRSR